MAPSSSGLGQSDLSDRSRGYLMYYVYIIKSVTTGRFYVGSTSRVGLRVEYHNKGWSRATKGRRPWVLVHTEKYEDKSTGLKREREIKTWKSSKLIESLINGLVV